MNDNKTYHSRKSKNNRNFVVVIIIIAFMFVFGGLILITNGLNKAQSTNSGETTNTTLAPTTTEPTTTEPDLSTREIKLQFAGDTLLHLKPVDVAKTGSNTYDFTSFFTEISDYVDGDLSVFNMESPVNAFGDNKDLSSYPFFNVPYEILTSMQNTGFNFAVTANNHSYDKGMTGIKGTIASMQRAGLAYTGVNSTPEQYDDYSIIDCDGIKVGIISYSDSDNGNSWIMKEEELGFAMRKFTSTPDSADIDKMIADMQKCRELGAEFIVLSLHWGFEYIDSPPNGFEEIAKKLCDGGADIIMGSHSHCVQPIEKYTANRNGEETETIIIYSLGNFFADQIALGKSKTQAGMLVNIGIFKNKDGEIEFGDCGYIPTLSYRYTQDGKTQYKVLPAEKFATSSERPEIFSSNSEWDKAQAAFEHVKKVVGDDLPTIK